MTTPLVSVIVPTFNRPDVLRSALASVSAQTLLAEDTVEMVVVNDAGTDVTDVVAVTDAFTDILERAGGKGRLTVRLLTLAANRGLPAARNVALEVARGRWVAFLDDDDLWLPDHLRVVVAAGEAAGVQVAHATCLVADRRLSLLTAPLAVASGAGVRFDQPYDPQALLVSNMLPIHAAVCRHPFESGVRFDETVRVQEDWRFWLDLAVGRGWRGIHVNTTTAIYHRIPSDAAMTTWASSAADRDAAVTSARAFADGARTVWARWPVPPGSPAAAGRAWVDAMYAAIGERMAVGGPVGHYYYEQTVTAIHLGLRGLLDDGEVRSRIRSYVNGTPARSARQGAPGEARS